MEYRYLDHIAIADVAFEARAKDLESLFKAASDAMMNLMVDPIDSIQKKIIREIRLADAEIDMLLFQFLQELIYLKDAENLLLRASNIRIAEDGNQYSLTAELYGETIDPDCHELNADVKAVTLHRFRVRKTMHGWTATVVLDV
jgi:SHS2 domain-containing protein